VEIVAPEHGNVQADFFREAVSFYHLAIISCKTYANILCPLDPDSSKE